MDKNILITVILYCVAELLLLISTNQLFGKKILKKRIILALLFCCIYCLACLCIPFPIIRSPVGRLLSLLTMGWIVFGSSWQCSAVFVLLSLALVGMVTNAQSIWFWILSTLTIGGLSLLGFRNLSVRRYVPVVLRHNDQSVALTALRDTGNTLCDPVTGQPVMVVAAEIAGKLMGLTPEELCLPIHTIRRLPGSRLIPYHSVGCNEGFLLAVRLGDVTVGSWRGSCLVAFAPNALGAGEFQALIGGTL